MPSNKRSGFTCVKAGGSFECFKWNREDKDSALYANRFMLHGYVETEHVIREGYGDTAKNCDDHLFRTSLQFIIYCNRASRR
jgi:hypothetical protein